MKHQGHPIWIDLKKNHRKEKDTRRSLAELRHRSPSSNIQLLANDVQ